MLRSLKSFSLAEILIALIVIGIVSSLTIPILIQNVQDIGYKIAYKKAVSDATRAWISVYNDNLLRPRSGWVADTANDFNWNIFKTKFNIVKECSSNNAYSCWESGETFYGTPQNSDIVFMDNSGRAWAIAQQWGYVVVDTNGSKGQNKLGKDRFPLVTYINSNITAPGIPNNIKGALYDVTWIDSDECPSPPCYYKSWITDAK